VDDCIFSKTATSRRRDAGAGLGWWIEVCRLWNGTAEMKADTPMACMVAREIS